MDKLFGGAGEDVMDAGPPAPRRPSTTCTGRRATTGCGAGPHIDLLYGNDGDDKLAGLAGNDQLRGGNDDDILRGGLDDDLLL
jgi:Ca2+-binding RTX toxin-like protein